jgi:hypothetical protein
MLEALGKQAQPVAIPPQQLDQIAAAAACAKRSTSRLFLLYLGREPTPRLRAAYQAFDLYRASTGR